MKNSFLTIVVILVLTAGNAVAQHFEWVRGYAPGNQASIVGSVTDSLGNLYILGSINANTCWENGSRLMPTFPYSYGQDNGDVLIAKISPDGDLVWHKVIHGNYRSSTPYDIKPLGDTAFACLVSTPLASCDYYLYYLDTLVRPTWNYGDGIPLSAETPWPDYPLNAKDICGAYPLALITFDFDGNVLEQHFLRMTYLDRNGENFTYPPALPVHPEPYLFDNTPENPSFAIDSEGNIYLSHFTYHWAPLAGYPDVSYTVEDGDICAVQFWCDYRMVGVVPIDSIYAFTPQILKFSPHFDTLLQSRYVFQNNTNRYRTYSNYLSLDKYNNLYYVDYVSNIKLREFVLSIDSLKHKEVKVETYNDLKGFLVQYNPDLEVSSVVSLDDSIIYENYYFLHSQNEFYDIAFDNDNDLLFISGTTGRGAFGDTSSFFSVLQYQGISLSELKHDAFFLAFKIEADTLRFYSYGRVNSKMESQITQAFPVVHGNIAAKNNRLFLQSLNVGGVRYPGQNIEFPSWSDQSPGLTIFDYEGNVIGGEHYSSFGSGNRAGPIAIVDSSLYLMNKLTSSAVFGDIHTPSRGSYFACIAKYNDPAFSRTYVRPRDTTVCVTVEEEELTVVRYPNPTTGRLTIDMKDRPLREAWVAAMDGIAEPLPVTPLGGGRYAADLSARPDGTYILVLVADDHRAYRATVILQR